MQQLYMQLQTELDKLDCLRKNWTYFSLKRKDLLDKLNINASTAEAIIDFDCNAQDNLD